MIAIVPYHCDWPSEFAQLGRTIRAALPEQALRIDHIGSTSVPGLAAKDIIDIQVTASDLSADIEARLHEAGYERLEHITQDHLPPRGGVEPGAWAKWFFTQRGDTRRVNLHVRLRGRANQRYALLFRDYLRVHATAASAYTQVKLALARYHADDIDAYYEIKDPVCDIIMAGAESWAAATQWGPGPSDQ
jgi:GrpB-like predicted nucleotidyltransferase (UPF0157 family)